MNKFLADLGIFTIEVNIGEKIDEELPYGFSPESNKHITNDPAQKDVIYDILRYAYAFQENKDLENQRIIDGEVVVFVLR
mgnify:CR=1 FL=1